MVDSTSENNVWTLPICDPASPERWDKAVPLPPRRANNPVQFGHHLEYGLARLMSGLFGLMGIDRASAFLGKGFRAVGPHIKPISNRALRNLRYVMPNNSEADNKAIVRDIWENFGRTIAEFTQLEQFRPLSDGRVALEGADILEDLVRNQRQAIYFSGHFANWEMMSPLLYRAGVRNGFVYRPMNNPLADEWVIKKRAACMSRVQLPKGKQGSRDLLKIMQQGHSLLMLVDQRLNSGEPIPFLNKPAMTAVAAARMAIKYKCPLVPVAIQRDREKGAYFKLMIKPPFMPDMTGNLRDDVTNTQIKVNEALGQMIMEAPGDWLWFHTRWGKDAVRDL